MLKLLLRYIKKLAEQLQISGWVLVKSTMIMKYLKIGILFLIISSFFSNSNAQTCGNNCGENLISNGNFEEGYKDFLTNNTKVDSFNNPQPCGGQYKLDTSSIPHSETDNNGSVWTVGADHTSGNGLFLIADPPCTSDGVDVYRSIQIPLEIGETYNFSSWAANLSPNNNLPVVILRVSIPGSGNLQDVATLPIQYDAENPWVQVCGQFVATSSGPHILIISVDASADIAKGGDLGLDDVSLYKNVTEGGNNTGTLTTNACDSFIFPSGSRTVFESGNYTDTLTNAAGCDSILSIALTVNESSFSELEIEGCDSVTAPSGKVFYVSGNYMDTITNTAGCDSIISLSLVIPSSSTNEIKVTVCESYVSPSGKTFTEEGIFMDTIPNSFGCDSIITIDITLDNPNSTQTMAVCDSFISPLLNVYKESGEYFETYTSSQGCDSVVTFDLTINQTTTAEVQSTSCENYIAPSGKEYSQTGIYIDTIPNAANCDSIITIDYTRDVKVNEIVAEACDSFKSNKGIVYKTSGEFEETFTTTDGCDSVLTLILTINQSTNEDLIVNSCDDYTSPSGKIFATSGSYLDTIPTSKGCDSIFNIELTIGELTSELEIEVCDSYTSNKGNTYTESGTYTEVFTTSAGCDSTVTLTLTINSVTATLTDEDGVLTADLAGQTYQWLDCDGFSEISGENNQSFTPEASGEYAVKITSTKGCVDTSECVWVMFLSVKNPLENEISIFPNPSSGAITFDIKKDGKFMGEIYNLSGKVLRSFSVSNQGKQVDLSDLGSGVYVISLSDETGIVLIEKIVLVR